MAHTKDAVKTRPAKTAGKTNGFNADERAARRESEQIPVGGIALRRARRVWGVTLQMQELLAEQERCARRARRHQIQADELEDKALETGAEVDDEALDELLDQAREAQTRANEITFELIATLTRTDDDTEPAVEHLKEHLDVEDAAALVTKLTSTDDAAEAAANPTPTSDSPDMSSS